MKNKKFIDEIVKRIISESLYEKTEELMSKIKNKVESCDECGSSLTEGVCNECGWSGNMEEGIHDVEAGTHFPKHQSFDYVEEDLEESRDSYNETEAQREMCKQIAKERPEDKKIQVIVFHFLNSHLLLNQEQLLLPLLFI